MGEPVFDTPGVPLEGLPLETVGLMPLLVLKLFAGGRLDLRDAAELVAVHPELDLDELRETAAQFGLVAELTRVLEDVSGD